MNPGRLHGEVEGTRPLHAAGGRVSIAGWCLLAGASTVPSVRLVTPAGSLAQTSRHARTDVPALLPAEPAAANCGFRIEGALPAGVHLADFEAQLPDGSWRVFKRLTLAVEAAPFAAALDTPVGSGVLRDRVKVGGWALDPSQPVREIHLRYGHRRIACVPHQPRADVAATFPDVPHAARAGFTSGDFLVAGHGPVRIEALLADGRTAIATTPVEFSIATDENHGPELDLTAPRVGLERMPSPLNPPPPERAVRPLNILFILPGSFASNSALHVAALAAELTAAGHSCAVAVAHDPETVNHLDRPAFRGLTHAMAENDPDFPDKRGPDIVHAWTTRENVRQLGEKLRSRHRSQVIVHLEDNEQQVLAFSLARTPAEIARLSDAELDRLVPADLSHPRLSRGFLARCDSVTVITDRLREFVPPGKACLTLTPAADGRHFFPRPVPAAFRDALRLAPGATVLFYHGNVHAANAAEVRELYAAVLALNREGLPVTLLRTGLDTVDFLGGLAAETAPHVLPLGQILHHRHLPPLMALADIFVQPGRPDAFNDYRFPSKLPEFFALGRPVILPRTNLGAQLRHGVDAFVLENADAAGIAAAIRALRQDRALYDRLSRGAAEFAARQFSWRRSAAALAGFYVSRSPGDSPRATAPHLFVTGGRGRLASLIASHFGGKDFPVRLFSRAAGPGFAPVESFAAVGSQAGDVLLHLAWSTLPATSEADPGAEERHDLPALEKMLQGLAALPAERRPHFIFFSSGGAVYGNAPGRPNREDDPCRPIGRYGRGKLAAEELIGRLAARHGLPCAILRISNPYGYPVPEERAQGVIPHAIRCALKGQPLALWGDGHARKDFLHYTDFLTGLEAVITRRLTGTYNLCAGESHTVREVIALVEKHTGKKIPLTFQPARAWDVEDSSLDPARLVSASGWRPHVSLEEGIRRSIAGLPAA
jgi:UDP-glucose 4-epimerase